MADKIDIVNRALRQFGVSNLTLADLTAEDMPEARVVNDTYEQIRDELMEMHPWDFAIAHRNLEYAAGYDATYDKKTITGCTQADPVVITAAAHGFATGDFGIIEDIGGTEELEGGTYHTTVLTVNTLQLTGINGTNQTAYTSGGTIRKHQLLTEYDGGYTYDKPSDFLAPLHLEKMEGDSAEYEIVGDYILSATENANIIYIKQVTTESEFTPLFTRFFVLALALEWVAALVGIDEKALALGASINRRYEVAKDQAQTHHAKRQYKPAKPEYSWITVRPGR